jgi:hypothetical protein
MPEGMNVHVAHKLSEREREERAKRRWQEVVEILEVLALAIAAVATAWSGYQAARGDGHQSVLYAESSRARFQADAASTLGGQQLAADASMFTAWLQARDAGDAWLKTQPFTDPAAPPGPGYMPQYRNPQLERAEQLNAQASDDFEKGTAARETADRYVRVTVLFALVLFLIAVAQRFRTRGARIGANALAIGLLVYGLYTVSTLPRF